MWLFVCSKCGHKIEQEEIITGGCSGCGASSWLCHKLTEDTPKNAFKLPSVVVGHTAGRNEIKSRRIV